MRYSKAAHIFVYRQQKQLTLAVGFDVGDSVGLVVGLCVAIYKSIVDNIRLKVRMKKKTCLHYINSHLWADW